MEVSLSLFRPEGRLIWAPYRQAAGVRCAESSAGRVPAPDATDGICWRQAAARHRPGRLHSSNLSATAWWRRGAACCRLRAGRTDVPRRLQVAEYGRRLLAERGEGADQPEQNGGGEGAGGRRQQGAQQPDE